MRRRVSLLALIALAVSPNIPAAPPRTGAGSDMPPGKSAEDSLRSIRVRPGFTVELVASEPLVADPIAFDWTADGRLWVVEMGDYPLGQDGKGKPGGVVRTLEDSDGDGRYDKATTFLDGLGFPTGLLPWKNGLLVACAPEIFYAEDRDGDGKADHREVLFTGFNEGNQQHRANGFDLGLDGWVYGANGDSGGTIRSVKTGQTVNISGRDFRFRPDDGRFEAESGQTQFGRHRDDWGHWFGNNNPNFAWEYVLSDAELRRNPKVALPNPKQMLEPDNRLYPASRTLARFNVPDAANRVTSANSPTPYRDDLFGPDFATSLFVSEPVHNLVHRMVLEPSGATFAGHRAADEAGSEFFASSDNWCRPTMLKTGPDGAIWIADMYRAVIEHPQWIPDDWEARLDLRAGSDQGRIYRVYPSGKKPRPIPRLDRLDTAGLVAALDSPSGWQRDNAQRLLMQRNDPAAARPLQEIARKSLNPKARLQALWTLENLGLLTLEPVLIAASDPHPQVRRNALRAGEGLLRDQAAPALADALIRLADDPDPQVRFQLALSVSQWNDARAGQVLARVIRRDPADSWFRAAVLSSAPGRVVFFLTALFQDAGKEPPPAAIVEPLFLMAGTLDDRKALIPLIDTLCTPTGQGRHYASWQFSALAGWLDAAARSRQTIDLAPFDGLLQAARTLAGDDSAGEDDRLRAIRLLGRDSRHADADREALVALLRPQVSSALQQAAVTALGRNDERRVAELLLSGWRGHSPQLRSVILDALLSRPGWTSVLLSSLEDTCTPPAEIDPAHRKRLLDHRDATVRHRAEAVFDAGAGSPSRQAVVDAYRPALTKPGDPAAGLAIFQKVCATCHKLGGVGTDVGPDLAALTDKSPESLLAAILDPNRAVEAKYTSFNVSLNDGRVLTGMVAGETSSSVTLRRQEGKEDVLLRSDIEGLAGSGQSLMPEGLEKDLSAENLADLIAFLKTAGPPPKTVAGNHPERVKPGPDGTITLRAETAEIFGDTLTYEAEHRNLGTWSAKNDRAAWQFEVFRPGRYAVRIDAACDDRTAGNRLVLEVGTNRLESTVAGTGSWEDYKSAAIGVITLSEGPQRLEVHPSGAIRGALLDLRSIELRPAEPQ